MAALRALIERAAPSDVADPGAGRERHRQGAGGPRHPRAVAATRRALRADELRRGAGGAGRERAVRPREGRLLRRHRPAPRPLRAGRRRHAVPRRDRRHARADAGQAAARPAGRRASRAWAAPARSACDVRVISATNRDLETLLGEGRFREDLYYRINTVSVRVPALRERRERRPRPGRALRRGRLRAGTTGRRAASAAEAIDLLRQQPWRGNVRELRNIVERVLILSGARPGRRRATCARRCRTPRAPPARAADPCRGTAARPGRRPSSAT